MFVALGAELALALACSDILGIDDGAARGDASVEASAADAGADASPPIDSGPKDVAVDVPDTAPYSPLLCGASTCNAAFEGCCRTGPPDPDAASYTFACVSKVTDCTGADSVLVTCDRPDNCAAQGHPGTICCGLAPIGQLAKSFGCVAAASCASMGAIMCEPGDDELCDQDAGQACLPSSITAVGWLICK